MKDFLSELGPMIAFYVANHFWGLKPAIALSLTLCAAETFRRLYRGERLSTLFKYSSAMTLAFGIVDLIAQHSFLFRYEASVTNFMTAAFFAGSLRGGKSVLGEFYGKKKDSQPMTPERILFFRWLTCMWVAYFVAKSAAYAWIGARMDIEQALIVRVLVGSASFYALLAFSIFRGRKVYDFLNARGWLTPSRLSES
jgi:intracellular septation protein A